MIRPVTPHDAAAICGIYNHYVENTTISFEEAPLSQTEMEERIRTISAKFPYIVHEDESGEINGFAYINKWRERSAYHRSAEISIYIKDGFQGKGLGTTLMDKLIGETRKTGIHALVAGITIPNHNSIALHEKFGFEKIGHFKEIGQKFGRWIDVGYWELILR